MSLRTLSPALEKIARVECNEDPNRLKDSLQHIKDWIAKQPHLRARTDDQWLAAFLRGCKYSLERAKEKLDLYYTLRSTAPELFRIKHNDPLFNEIMDRGFFLPLINTAEYTSNSVVIIRLRKFDPLKYTLMDFFSAALGVIVQIMMMDYDQPSVAGSITIIDFSGTNVNHFVQATPSNVKKLIMLGQDATPIRMRGLHCINTSSSVETIFKFAKPMLNEKNKSRIHLSHKNYEVLYKHVPIEILPPEYGGKGSSIQETIDFWKNKIKQYSDFLNEDYQYGTDERKRLGKPRTAEDMFGAEGSFRKLQLD